MPCRDESVRGAGASNDNLMVTDGFRERASWLESHSLPPEPSLERAAEPRAESSRTPSPPVECDESSPLTIRRTVEDPLSKERWRRIERIEEHDVA